MSAGISARVVPVKYNSEFCDRWPFAYSERGNSAFTTPVGSDISENGWNKNSIEPQGN